MPRLACWSSEANGRVLRSRSCSLAGGERGNREEHEGGHGNEGRDGL